MLKILTDRKHQIVLSVVLVIILGSILTKGFSNFKFASKNKIAEKGVAFIKEQVLKQNPSAKITLDKVETYHAMVKATVTIDTEKVELYITSDGKVAFVQPIVIDQKEIAKEASTKIVKRDKVDVKLFTMAYCPFGNEAETAILPVEVLLRNDVTIEPHYVIYSDYPSKDQLKDYCWKADDKYCSMHGINELKQDVRELCIYKYNKSSFWNYIKLVNQDCTVDNIETCWKNPAKTLNIDTAKIETCLKSEGESILATEKALNDKYQVTGSPMLLINEAEYQGDRTSEGYKTGICNGFKKQPKACSQTLATSSANAPASGSCK